MNDERLLRAAGLGAVTGLRSMTGLAATSRELADRWWLGRRASRLEQWLADDTVAAGLTILAAGELIADKMPGVPDRVTPGPLLGRGAIGAVLGGIAAGPERRGLGALVGAAAALLSSYVGWLLRGEIGRATGGTPCPGRGRVRSRAVSAWWGPPGPPDPAARRR